VYAAESLAEARIALQSGAPFDVWILADPLPDGRVFELFRECEAPPPTLILFRRTDAAHMNEAVSYGAVPAVWPLGPRQLAGFLRSARSWAANRLEAQVAHARRTAKLSARQAAVFREVIAGTLADEIAIRHGVKVSTIRTQISVILRKLKEPSVDALRAKTLRKILMPADSHGAPRVRSSRRSR
jgi:DNA-binding NarL/FixJ family response regulator